MSGLCVFVTDASRADIYDLESPRSRLRKNGSIVNPVARRHDRDLGSDAPGRVLNRMGGVRQAYQPRIPLKRRAAESFARIVAEAISAAAQNHDIVLVAAPRQMGTIRRSLTAPVLARIVGELRHDLVDLPQLQLQRRIRKQLMAPIL